MASFRCYGNSDVIATHDKFSSLSNTTAVAIFPNVCLWRRSLCWNLVLTLKNCIEPPSYASTAYGVSILPSFLFDCFVKIWQLARFLGGKWFPPPGKKLPVRLWLHTSESWSTHVLYTVLLFHTVFKSWKVYSGLKAPWVIFSFPSVGGELEILWRCDQQLHIPRTKDQFCHKLCGFDPIDLFPLILYPIIHMN